MPRAKYGILGVAMADDPKRPKVPRIVPFKLPDVPKLPSLPISLRDVLSASETPPTGLGSLLAQGWPLQPPVIKDRWFKDETIRVDGYTFERCRFDGCKLVTEMATFSFKHCFIGQDSGLYLIGPALKVARLLMHVLRVKGRITILEGEESMYATVHDDGTFSIE